MILWFWLTTKTFGFQVYQTILPHHRPPFEKDGFIPARRNRFRVLSAHEKTCHSRNTSNPKDRCSSPPGSPICFCSHELSRRSWRDKTEALDGAVPRGKPPSSSRHAQLRMLNTLCSGTRALYVYVASGLFDRTKRLPILDWFPGARTDVLQTRRMCGAQCSGEVRLLNRILAFQRFRMGERTLRLHSIVRTDEIASRNTSS